jgi:hypothetical protein
MAPGIAASRCFPLKPAATQRTLYAGITPGEGRPERPFLVLARRVLPAAEERPTGIAR